LLGSTDDFPHYMKRPFFEQWRNTFHRLSGVVRGTYGRDKVLQELALATIVWPYRYRQVPRL
jgi:hypothetical protein